MLQHPSVIACIDGSGLSSAVCDYAGWASVSLGKPLALLHTIEPQSNVSHADYSGNIGVESRRSLLQEIVTTEEKRSRLLVEQGRFMLEDAKKRIFERGQSEPFLLQRHDGLVQTLIDLEDRIEMVVLGVRGQDHTEDGRGLGQHLEATIRSIHRPIFVVNCDFTQPQKFMIAFDGEEASRKAVTMVARNANALRNLDCHMVSVSEKQATSSQETIFYNAVQELIDAGIDVQQKKLSGNVVNALCTYQEHHAIDFTVMGAFGHSRLRDFFMGSITNDMLLQAKKPLLMLR